MLVVIGSDSITVSVDDGGLKMLQITDTGTYIMFVIFNTGYGYIHVLLKLL